MSDTEPDPTEQEPEIPRIEVAAVRIGIGTGTLMYGDRTVEVFFLEIHGAYIGKDEVEPVIVGLALDSAQAASLMLNLGPIVHTVPTPKQQAATWLVQEDPEQGEE